MAETGGLDPEDDSFSDWSRENKIMLTRLNAHLLRAFKLHFLFMGMLLNSSIFERKSV